MVGEVIGGRFEIEELVGTGGMSSVYRAHDRLLERKVALKILHDTFGADEATIERFRREARAAAQLSHPGIVTVIDRGEDAGRQFIVFEYVEGENLKNLVERGGRLPVRQALELTIETGRALAFAHQHGLVHRDVKPQNVLLNGDGQPKMTDFGIARAVDASLTESGAVLGTSHYISPEQASGEHVDAQSDIYSLGVVLFELLTGEVPFEGENFVAVAAQHVNEPAPSVLDRRPDVPVRVAHAVERALAKEPARRFDSMDDFVAELETCRAELGSDPDRDSTAILRAEPLPPLRPRRTTRRRSAWPVILLLFGLGALGAVVAAAFLLGGDSPGPSGEPASAPKPVRLVGLASYDPEGDDKVEHPEAVARATDRDPTTYWYTATYEDFDALKSGVGLVLDARGAKPSEITVETSTPGFTARIDAGARPTGPFKPVADEQQVGRSTTYELDDTEVRYYVVWITNIPESSRAEITEIKAR